jgi:hypothetical protein
MKYESIGAYLEDSALKLGQPTPPDEVGELQAINALVKQRVAASDACGELAAELARLEVWVSTHLTRDGGAEKFLYLLGQVQEKYQKLERTLTERP